MGALLRLHLHDLTHDHLADAGVQRDEFLDLKAAGEELFFKLLCGNVNIDEFF